MLEDDGRTLPREVSSALADHEAFGPVQAWQAEPEVRLPFHNFAGERRNTDRVVHAQDAQGPFLIAFGAADEPFGATVAATLAAAVDRKLENNRSDSVTRIEQLVTAVLGPRQTGDPALRVVRYRLLATCAGVLSEAERRGYSRALMLIHEFVTLKTSDDQRVHNAADLNTFVRRLSHGSVRAVQAGRIYGPFVVPGPPLLSAKVALFVGKVSRNLRTNGA